MASCIHEQTAQLNLSHLRPEELDPTILTTVSFCSNNRHVDVTSKNHNSGLNTFGHAYSLRLCPPKLLFIQFVIGMEGKCSQEMLPTAAFLQLPALCILFSHIQIHSSTRCRKSPQYCALLPPGVRGTDLLIFSTCQALPSPALVMPFLPRPSVKDHTLVLTTQAILATSELCHRREIKDTNNC